MDDREAQIVRWGVAVVVERAGRLLVIRRSQNVLAPGKICFPGGGIEPDESEEEAVVREMQEELGIVSRPRSLMWRSVTAWRIALAWWHTELDHTTPITPNPLEVAEIAWLTPKEMLRSPDLLDSNVEFLERMLAGEFAAYFYAGTG